MNLNDFIVNIFCETDNFMKKFFPPRTLGKRGPLPQPADSEVLTMEIVGECLGLEVHEEPVLSGNNRDKLQEGMVFTVEPGVYIPGKLGVRIEDDILVTETGSKILTHNCPHWPLPPT